MNPETVTSLPAAGVITLDAPPEAARVAPLPPRGILDAVLDATNATNVAERIPPALDRFLGESAPAAALAQWLGPLPAARGAALKQAVLGRLNRDIGRIDALLNEQVNAILHDQHFQKLEASWRSLRNLVEQTEGAKDVVIKVLNVSWKELTRDIQRASEFDQSELFRKVYSDQFGTPGGKPFGVLLGDYEIRHRMTPDHPYNDVETLTAISEVAAAAFAPFVAAAHPSLLDLESFTELERSLNLADTFRQMDYLKWKAFRKKDEARFVGLTMPRVLARLPYVDDSGRTDGFRFQEDLGGPSRRNYLWGNAAYAFVGVLIRAYVDTGWLADIRGVRRGELSGGVVAGLPIHHFSTDSLGIAPKCSTDTIITDAQEKELGAYGLIPLCYCQDTELSAFYGNQSVQEAKEFTDLAASVNSRMSAMLQYILCASRFAHYVKAMIRDYTGKFTTAQEMQHFLHRWLQRYTSVTPEPVHPLKRAEVEIEESQPGKYTCRMFFQPHYQLDQLVSSLRLDSILAPGERLDRKEINMTAHDLFEAGNIPEAIKAASEEVKKKPLDAGKRMVLCELQCFAGELEKADRELETLSGLDPQEPDALIHVNWMRQLIRGEMARQDFYMKGRLPDFLNDEVAPDLRRHLEASILLRDGKIAEGAALLAQAEEERPKAPGVCNGQPFDDLRDLDDLTSSFFEVLTSTGKYFWIPIERVELIEFHPPVRMRDLLWRRAHMTVRAGPDGEVFLPTLYAGAAADANVEVRLGRTTEWRGESPIRGAGQKMYLVGENALSILELQSISIESSATV